MADTATETLPDEFPDVLHKLSEQDRNSLRSFVTEILEEWGSVGDEDIKKITENWGFTREDSIDVIKFIESDANILSSVDLETKSLKISKNTYEIGRLLGTGKYAEVRRGRNTRNGKTYALKILYVDGTRKEVRLLRDQIKDELRAFKKIRHKNIVRLHAFDCKQVITHKGNLERPCMIQVQELCEKGELYDYVQYNGHLPEKLCRSIFMGFAKGLHACHSKGIAHRDLKPDNVLVDRSFNVKLCDFGFAKAFTKSTDGGARRVNMRTILGTPGYMSPEMLLKMPYNEKTDVFSAGVILFILLAGYPPLQTAEIGDWWFERLLEGRHHKFWQAHERGEVRFSAEAKQLIIGMLEPNPAERWSIYDVLNSEFFQKETYSESEFRDVMEQLKNQVDIKRAEARSEVTRDTEVTNVTGFVDSLGPQWKPSLERLVENKFVTQLKAVSSEEELMLALNTIENKISGIDLRHSLRVEDPIQTATMLAASRTLDALKDVVSLDDASAEDLLVLLSPMKETAVDGHIKGIGEFDERFFTLKDLELPVYNAELETLPLHTYKLRCGFDILAFALRYVTRAKTSGRMNPLPNQGLIETQFRITEKHELLITDDPALQENPDLEQERKAAQIKRLEALGLSAEAIKATVPESTTYLLNIDVQCMQDPENSDAMIVSFKRQDNNFGSTADFSDIVEIILHQTCLQAFLLEEEVEGQ